MENSDNIAISAEMIKNEALNYLNANYSDTFIAKSFSAESWAYDYYSVFFSSEKYSGSHVEVRVYKNNDGTYKFKDNYYHLYMLDEAVAYLENLAGFTDISINVSFLNTIWSDELGNAKSFSEWIDNKSCELDIYVITKDKLDEQVQKAYVQSIANSNISGFVTFIETKNTDILNAESLDDILKNEVDYIVTNNYYIDGKFMVEEK